MTQQKVYFKDYKYSEKQPWYFPGNWKIINIETVSARAGFFGYTYNRVWYIIEEEELKKI